jgi:hypothetical protein
MESDDNLFLKGCDRTTAVQRTRRLHPNGEAAASVRTRIFKNTVLYARCHPSGIGIAIR